MRQPGLGLLEAGPLASWAIFSTCNRTLIYTPKTPTRPKGFVMLSINVLYCIA